MRRHLMLSLLLGSIATGLQAQANAPSWGLSAESLLSINAFAFEPLDNSIGYTVGTFAARYITAGTGIWGAPLDLPSGALVTGLELQGCDDSDPGQLILSVLRVTVVAGVEASTTVGIALATGSAAIPGCAHFAVSFPVPATIDNSTNVYLVRIQQSGDFTGLVRFAGARVRYRLQISPPPGVATFADVPVAHQQFRFVEALFAAGITAGCGGGNFCPDEPLTRGQMAVFLAAALGLHFPN